MEERPINFNLLHKDELIYEVALRDAKPADTVAGLRSQIKILAKEYPSDEIDTYDGDITSELEIISDKLVELSELCTVKQLRLKNLNRINVLGNHLFHRIGRLSPSEKEDVAKLSNLQSKLDKIISKVDDLFKSYKESFKDSIHPPTIEEECPTPATVNVSCDRSKGVHTLSLKFNGRSCVLTFVQRLEELSLSRGITHQRLFEGAPELFSEEALFWYRSISNTVNSWTELKNCLLDEYLPLDYDQRLLDEIRSRTQGRDESIINYLSIMRNYFSRLRVPLSEEEQLRLVRYNLRPNYNPQLTLVDIKSWSDLKAKCRALEYAKQRADSFTEPPRPSSNSIAPDLANRGVRKPINLVSQDSTKPSEYCVRCRKSGHALSNCSVKPFLVCYRCGENNYSVKTCPKCNKGKSPKPKLESDSKNLSERTTEGKSSSPVTHQ